MNGKEAMKAALECRQPETAVPIWELEFHLWDQASGKHAYFGREFEGLAMKEQEKALYENAEIIVSVAKKLNFSAITVPGGLWYIAPGEPAYYWLPEEARLKQIHILKEYVGNEMMLIGNSGGIMGMPHASHYVEFCYKLIDAPEEIDEIAKKTFNNGIEKAKKLIDAGVDAVLSPSDIADNRGLFYNPEQMDRFILPYLSKWAEEVKTMGVYSILHSDGNLEKCIEEIAASGLHALQAIDPVAGMDIRRIKEQVKGRLCLCGNVDCGNILTGPREKVYEETKALLIDCKKDGGLVLGASNAVQMEAPMDFYSELTRAWVEYGMY